MGLLNNECGTNGKSERTCEESGPNSDRAGPAATSRAFQESAPQPFFLIRLTLAPRRAAHLLGFDQFELHAAAGPRDEVGVARVVQQGDQELPELQRPAALVGRTLAKDASALLLDLAWKRGKREVDSGTSAFL